MVHKDCFYNRSQLSTGLCSCCIVLITIVAEAQPLPSLLPLSLLLPLVSLLLYLLLLLHEEAEKTTNQATGVTDTVHRGHRRIPQDLLTRLRRAHGPRTLKAKEHKGAAGMHL